MKSKILVFFYTISVFAMANDALSNWIFNSFGLNIWRQLIWLVGLVVLLQFISTQKNKYPYLRKTINKYVAFSFILIILSLGTLLIKGFSLIRVAYAFLDYFYGVMFIIMPFVLSQNGWDRSKINKFFIWLSLFFSMGYILDYMLGGILTLFFHQNLDDFTLLDSGRFSCFTTSPTMLSVFSCLCLMCCFSEYKKARPVYKGFFLIVTLLIIFGSVFSGSRQTLLVLLIEEFFGVLYIMKGRKINPVPFFLTAIIIVLLAPYANQMLSDNGGFNNRYNAEAIEEDSRSGSWQQGFIDTFSSVTRLTIGDGVGYIHGQQAGTKEIVGYHYENTFFARASEIGLILALITLLIPAVQMIRYRKTNSQFLLYAGMIIAYFFVSMVSPNGNAITTQIALFIALGMSYEDANKEDYHTKIVMHKRGL